MGEGCFAKIGPKKGFEGRVEGGKEGTGQHPSYEADQYVDVAFADGDGAGAGAEAQNGHADGKEGAAEYQAAQVNGFDVVVGPSAFDHEKEPDRGQADTKKEGFGHFETFEHGKTGDFVESIHAAPLDDGAKKEADQQNKGDGAVVLLLYQRDGFVDESKKIGMKGHWPSFLRW